VSEYKLTPEIKKDLMGLMPFSQKGTVSIIPEAYIDKGIPLDACPKFTQRAYTRKEFNEIMDKLDGKAKTGDPMFLEWGRKSIKAWEGIIDLATDEPIDFEGDENGNPKPEKWDLIPPLIQKNIFENAMKISGLVFVEKRGLTS